MVKSAIQFLLQKVLGYSNYLFLFALYSIYYFRYIKRDKEFDYFLQLITKQKGSTIIDVGANIGVTAVLLAMRFPNYQIKAFEPLQLHIAIIKKVIKHFGINNIEVNLMAIGNTAKMVSMGTPIKAGVVKHGWSFIKGEVQTPELQKLPLLTEQVQMNTLDAVCRNQDLSNVAAIKIDVENYELFVLEGAQSMIQQSQPLIFAELWNDQRRGECLTLMEKLGYTVMTYRNKELGPFKGNDALNFFFIPHKVSLIANNNKNEH